MPAYNKHNARRGDFPSAVAGLSGQRFEGFGQLAGAIESERHEIGVRAIWGNPNVRRVKID